MLLLLVHVGMEMDLANGRVGRASFLVAVMIALPFSSSITGGIALGLDTDTGDLRRCHAELRRASASPARYFGDLRALATTEARVALGAAVADDVLGLIILTVVVKVVSGDSVTVGLVVSTLLVAAGFLVLSGMAGIVAVHISLTARLARGRRRRWSPWWSSSASPCSLTPPSWPSSSAPSSPGSPSVAATSTSASLAT